MWVYPRVCGGTRDRCPVNGARRLRSIPACAGEPPARSPFHPKHKVYPRVCGGTAKSSGDRSDVIGLSPRVRGNRPLSIPSSSASGSIPACAGEPSLHSVSAYASTVYPRVCGGTKQWRAYCSVCLGLSPRVRGNRLALATFSSIRLVYPRVCGGTEPMDTAAPMDNGLSPRVRGNRSCVAIAFVSSRSIPACAGEP